MENRLGSRSFYSVLVGVAMCLVVYCDRTWGRFDRMLKQTTLETRVDDIRISGMVKSMLLADLEMSAVDFKVETRKGKVQLTGFIDNEPQINRAIALTRAVNGVKGVRINIGPKPTTTLLGKL